MEKMKIQGCNLQVTNGLHQDNNECPSCNVRLTVDHILWDCKDPEAERQRANIWDKEKDEMKE
jgi:hypothetical protein